MDRTEFETVKRNLEAFLLYADEIVKAAQALSNDAANNIACDTEDDAPAGFAQYVAPLMTRFYAVDDAVENLARAAESLHFWVQKAQINLNQAEITEVSDAG